MQKKPIISIITPFYNEQDSVNAYFEAMHDMAKHCAKADFEFICVDDGSTDNTLFTLIELSKKHKNIKIVQLTRNFGKEAALTAGLDYANKDAVIPIDADLQDPPTLIPTLVDHWLDGAEVVLARRINRSSDSFLKRITAQFFYSIYNKISPLEIPENVGDFRLMDSMVVDAIKQLPERQRFMKGLFSWVGYKTITVDYERPARAHGTSKFSGFKLWNFALEGLTNFSALPLKIWSYVGAIGAMFTFLYAVIIVMRTLLWGIDIPGYASLLVAVLFLGSLQLISIGILGEYIARIYMESKKRPIYLVRKTHGADLES